jgi:glutamine cyclotransferase
VAKDVLCEVENCEYWGQGNVCNAERIYVVTHKETKATTAEETDCKTFEPKH